MPGVSFRVARMSFARRLDLTRRVRDLLTRFDYLGAAQKPEEQIEASLLKQEIDRIYLQWGLLEIRGLEVDGESEPACELAEAAPEAFAAEVIARIKHEAGLSEAERKN